MAQEYTPASLPHGDSEIPTAEDRTAGTAHEEPEPDELPPLPTSRSIRLLKLFALENPIPEDGPIIAFDLKSFSLDEAPESPNGPIPSYCALSM